MQLKTKILAIVTDFYLKSGDFNGCSLNVIKDSQNIKMEEFKEAIIELIKEEMIGLITSNEEMNPHVIRTGFIPIEKQIENIKKIENQTTYCFYPLRKHLINVVETSNFGNAYYKLELALGAPQLSYKSFELSILEMYRNDPRYYYETNDIGGRIGVKDKYYESDKMNESDQVLLQSFGYSIDKNYNRAVGVFIWDLANLSVEHQRIWKAKELDNTYVMHPAYYKSQVYGSWTEGVSVFDALLKEIYIINQICLKIGYIKLFKNDFGEYGEGKPKFLTFLIRPTLKEFNDFILVLDKILSENIDRKFFEKDLNPEIETLRKDGKIIISNKGSIQLLDEWMRKKYRFQDDTGWKETIKTLRKVRLLRQKPAHIVEDDAFDDQYINDQKELSFEVYYSINFLRMLFQRNPKIKEEDINIPDWLEKGKIYAY